ncbi:MAG TPA: hypothetical protein VG326_00260 [Tepidisphaeraceae bacterium]|jgi:hypothetical protein|nr:hypothetical protein [Tepidisphaeraceae bacterium]
MTKVTITAEPSGSPTRSFRAATRGRESVGSTPGAALDALAEQLDETEANMLIIVQNMRPDEFFTAAQQQQLGELLAKRRTALDTGKEMEPAEKAKLETLIDAELDAATSRAATMINELRS